MPNDEKMNPLEVFAALGVDAGRTPGPQKLTDAQRAEQLGVQAEQLGATIELTPGEPRLSPKTFLSFTLPALVTADPEFDANGALFTSDIENGLFFPDVSVSFGPIDKSKSHLVEFCVRLSTQLLTYKFRIFQFPSGKFEDIAVYGTKPNEEKPICVLIPPTTDPSDLFGATLQQRNQAGDKAVWTFSKVRITSVA